MSLKMLSTRITNFCWKILDICYLGKEMFDQGTSIPAVTKMLPSRVEDPMIRADILIQTFREIGGVSERTLENKHRLLQKIERNYRIMDRLKGLQTAGWILMEDEQFQYLSMITSHTSQTTSVEDQSILPTKVANFKQLMDEDAVVMQSKISQIKDLFPDYGNGFLAACLEVYNQNPEEVIQRILEGMLHEDLKRLDTSSETMLQPKSSLTVGSKDKGKGKLVESDVKSSGTYREQLTKGPSSHTASSASSASSATGGRFIRKAKDDTPNHTILDVRNENDKTKNAALLAQYEYDDEYDDSFDDLGFSVGESAAEESERFGSRVGSVSAAESEPSSAPKWGSRKTPQFYVKDGKNYSYKVAGAVAVANANEASLVNEVEGELIHGLGRGGNIPLGAVKKLTEYQSQQDQNSRQSVTPEGDGRENARNSRGQGRGRGGRGGRGTPKEAYREQQNNNSNNNNNNNNNNLDVSETESRGGGRGRGRGRRGGGGGRDHHHKDRAMKKHIASISGF